MLAQRPMPTPVLNALAWSARHVGRVGPLRTALLRAAERRLRASLEVPAASLRHPRSVQADKVALALALLSLAERVLAQNALSPAALEALIGRLLRDVLGLDDVWSQPFFAGFRRWQRDYAYRQGGERYDGARGNGLMPCLIRDHHAHFQGLVREHAPAPTDTAAGEALGDEAYHEGLVEFDRRLAKLTDPLWRERYLHAPSRKPD